jgi:hypothetical protein
VWVRVCVGLCMCGFVCVGFFCNVWVCVCVGFCNVWVCVCVGFCNVWVSVWVGLCICGFL